MNVSATRLAALFAASFYAAGIIGFIPNPLVGPDGLFAANTAHNLFHIITAIGLTAVALIGRRASTIFMIAFGPVYALTGLLGFLITTDHGHGHLLGLIHLNVPDNFLHIGLGAVVGITGWLVRDQLKPEVRVAGV